MALDQHNVDDWEFDDDGKPVLPEEKDASKTLAPSEDRIPVFGRAVLAAAALAAGIELCSHSRSLPDDSTGARALHSQPP